MKVLVVDDHMLVRHGLAFVVKECFSDAEVTEAGSADEAIAALKRDPVDIALLDIRMPERDGLELLREVKAGWPDIPVIMLSTYDDARYAREALAQGAAGYMLKDSSPADLGQAMRVAQAGGGNVLSTRVIRNLFEDAEGMGNGSSTGPVTPHLTQREADILALLVEGLSNHDISVRLFLSEKTVKAHLASIFRKLGVANRTQAAMTALSLGIGHPETNGLAARAAAAARDSE